MAKVKVKRHAPSMDMTAMCDVAFLLLTFFILTTQFKGQESVTVDTPSSISQTIVDEKNMILVSLDKDGNTFLGMTNPNDKLAALEAMQSKYQLALSEKQKTLFTRLPDFGVSMAQLSGYLSMPEEQRKKVVQTGIPNDSLKSELADWVIAASNANREAKLGIRGDVNTNYPAVKKVLDAMQKNNINKFQLITDTETKAK